MDEDPEEPALVIVHRVADKPIAPIAYCTTAKCGGCGSKCWISPATLAAVAGIAWVAECLRCAVLRKPGSLAPQPRTPGQLAEIRRAGVDV